MRVSSSAASRRSAAVAARSAVRSRMVSTAPAWRPSAARTGRALPTAWTSVPSGRRMRQGASTTVSPRSTARASGSSCDGYGSPASVKSWYVAAYASGGTSSRATPCRRSAASFTNTMRPSTSATMTPSASCAAAARTSSPSAGAAAGGAKAGAGVVGLAGGCGN